MLCVADGTARRSFVARMGFRMLDVYACIRLRTRSSSVRFHSRVHDNLLGCHLFLVSSDLPYQLNPRETNDVPDRIPFFIHKMGEFGFSRKVEGDQEPKCRTSSADTTSVDKMVTKAWCTTNKATLRNPRIGKRERRTSRGIRARCSENQDGSNDALERATEQLAENLLAGKDVDVKEIQKLANASARVAAAHKNKEEIERAIDEFAVQEKKQAAATFAADEDLKNAAEKVLKAADALEEATAEREKAIQAARISSPLGLGSFLGATTEQGSDNLVVERLESVKALAVASGAGTLCLLPFSLTSGGSLLSLALGTATCGLFGVTYRYAIRQDSENIQLKSGVVAAFALARGFGETDVYVRASDGFSIQVVLESALLCGGSILLILFAALGLEAALQRGIIKAFPSAKD